MSQQTILIVDDDPAVRRLLSRALQGEQVRIIATESVSYAEAVFDDHTVDLVLCDQNMPGEQGLDFLGRLATRYPRVRRVLITGDLDPRLWRSACRDELIHRCLAKPFDVRSLRDTVSEMLDSTTPRFVATAG